MDIKNNETEKFITQLRHATHGERITTISATNNFND